MAELEIYKIKPWNGSTGSGKENRNIIDENFENLRINLQSNITNLSNKADSFNSTNEPVVYADSLNTIANMDAGGINTYGSIFTDGTGISADKWSIVDNIISSDRKFIKAQIHCLTGGGLKMLIINESTLEVVAEKTFTTITGQVLTITPSSFSEFDFETNTQKLGIYFQNISESNKVIAYKQGDSNKAKAVLVTGASGVLYRPYLISASLVFNEVSNEIVAGSIFTDGTGVTSEKWSIADNVISSDRKFVKAQIHCLTNGGLKMFLINEDTLEVVAEKSFTTVASQILTITPSSFTEFDFDNNVQKLGIYFQNVNEGSRALVFKTGEGNSSKVILSNGIEYRQFNLSIILVTNRPVMSPIVQEVQSLDLRLAILENPPFDIYEAVANNNLVNLPPTEILLTKTLVMPSNRKLIGVLGATILKVADGVSPAISINNVSNVKLQDFLIAGNDGTIDIETTTQGKGTKEEVLNDDGIGINNVIYVNASKLVNVQDVRISQFNGKALHLLNMNHANRYGSKFSVWIDHCYKGIDIDRSSEYLSIVDTRISDCIVAGSCCSGNVLFNNVSTPRNVNGFVWKGARYNTAYVNDSHSNVTGCDFNHCKNYSLIIEGISNGEVFTGLQVFDGKISINNSRGVVISGSELSATKIDVTGDTTALIANSVVFKTYSDGTINYPDIQTKLLLKNNFYIDGSDASAINN